MKPFTIISALLFLVIAAAHAYRAYAGLPVVVADMQIPIMASWICAGVTAILGIMLFVERK
jgi:hypothetical protein